jgi:hypothetical protein
VSDESAEQAAPPSERPSEPPPPVAPLSRLKRFSPFLLVAGLIAAAVLLIPHVPRERRIELRIEDPATVIGVELSWSAVDAAQRNEGDALEGARFRFEPGQAPALIKAPAHLADGRYALELSLERVGERVHVRRLITVGEDAAITIPLR